MFGFIRPNPLDRNTKPAAHSGTVLVSKEDIYRENRGMEPILLVRKGYEVSAEELPRFIRNGARPQQFQFKNANDSENSLQAISIRAPLPGTPKIPFPSNKGISIPIGLSGHSADKKTFTARSRKKTLILEPDQKGMKRLIDCLFICGLHLDRIHPVRITEHLSWALQKYRPQILIVDYHLQGPQNGLNVLISLRNLPGVEKAILTVAPRLILSEAENQVLQEICREKNIKILTKPVSRHTMNQILQD